MDIHEYQAKELLRSYRVTTPRGEVVYTSKAAARGRIALTWPRKRQPGS